MISKISNENQVWLTLHFLKMFTMSWAFWFHIIGVHQNIHEPFQHVVFCCGVFFTFIIYELLDIIRILSAARMKYLYLFMIELLASAIFFTSSMLSMHFAEIDVHLPYMDFKEEVKHPFFKVSRSQSVLALATATLHLLNACLLADSYFSYDKKSKKRKANRNTVFFNRDSARKRSLVSPATEPIVLALLHEEISCIVWIKKKLIQLFKKKDRDRSLLYVPKSWKKNTGQSQVSLGSGSVRFTWGYM